MLTLQTWLPSFQRSSALPEQIHTVDFCCIHGEPKGNVWAVSLNLKINILKSVTFFLSRAFGHRKTGAHQLDEKKIFTSSFLSHKKLSFF